MIRNGVDGRALLSLIDRDATGGEIKFGINDQIWWTIQGTDVSGQFSIWRIRSGVFKAVSINAQAYTTFHGGSTNASDRRLKHRDQVVNESECFNLLRQVNARTYERVDLDSGRRIGFFADDFADKAPAFGLTGTAQHTDAAGDIDILTLDYARLSAVLWTVCQSLLVRVESLEERVAQLSAP